MDFLSVTEISKAWGVTPKRIQVLCRDGRIPGAGKIGPVWLIPKDAQKPSDARIKSGKYTKSL